MTMPATYKGEVQLRRYSDTSTQGQQIVLSLPDRESLSQFIGLEGKRFAVMFVQLGDDEQPVPPEPKPRERLGDLCYRAVQWCGDPEFWAFLNATHSAMDEHVNDQHEAAERVKELCHVRSRKELDTDKTSGLMFRQKIVGPYQKWLIARGIVR